MMKNQVFFKKPIDIYELRKTYTDGVEFLTDTKTFPLVKGIAFEGALHSVIKGKKRLLNVEQKVNRLLELYKRKLFRIWDDKLDQVLSDKNITKAEDEEQEKKKKILAEVLASLSLALGDSAVDYYKRAYLIGKERGVSISGKEFVQAISQRGQDKILGLQQRNQEYLDNFVSDLHTKYSEALDKEYATKEAEEAEIKRISATAEARLNLYVPAILTALALGMTDGLQEGKPEVTPPTEGEEQVIPEEVSGIIWITNHDDNVCPGCAENDGKFFTFDEFEEEYQSNECISNCRCAETSEPTTSPMEHFARSARVENLQKGGPGSGCQGANCGRPNEGGSELWHGSPTGDFGEGHYGIHIGTKEAAKQALEAKIGIPAEGTWDGTREYGKTLLAGQKTLRQLDPKGYNVTGFNVDAPEEDYYLSDKGTKTQLAVYSDGTRIPKTVKPNIFPVKIKGKMTNSIEKPHSDIMANALMAGQMKRGTAKNGYYYRNEGEDVGSISAVVPNKEHLERAEAIDKFEKGGVGSGCHGPNCGRPSTGGSEFTLRTKYKTSFKFNDKDPVKTTSSSGKVIDKFVVTPENEFIPVHSTEPHAVALSDNGVKNFDAQTRVIQDLDRKVAFIRLGYPNERVITAAVVDGDERAMNMIIDYQRQVASRLYAKHPGMTIILASGGTPRAHNNNLPRDIDSGHEIPSRPETLVNKEFIFKN